jgi:hypothetical protein
MPVTPRALLSMVALGLSMTACSSSSGGTPVPDDASTHPDDAGVVVTNRDGASDADQDDASVVACATPEDCTAHIPAGAAVFCCIQGVCIFGQAAEAIPCTHPDAEVIAASDYDQSCQTDSDCMPVGVGDFCNPGEGNCANAAISKSAYPKYQADVAKTQAAVCVAASSCGGSFGPCCRQGTCQMGNDCSSPSDTLPRLRRRGRHVQPERDRVRRQGSRARRLMGLLRRDVLHPVVLELGPDPPPALGLRRRVVRPYRRPCHERRTGGTWARWSASSRGS